MYINEQYILYKIAYQLVSDDQFNVLHLNEQSHEIWLEKYEHKKSKVIRLIHKGFDWKNHLKSDIANVFQRTKSIKRLLSSKHVEIYNIYVTTYPPVDTWEELKRPMKLKEKNPIRMNLYYLDESDYQDELARMGTDIGTDQVETHEEMDSEVKETEIGQYQLYLKNALHRKRQEIENLFTFGKPILTFALIIMNVLFFILLEIRGGSTNIQNLIELGAKYNPAIIDGEWWRIVSSMFLHIGYLHLLMNMLAVYFLGSAVERIFGSWRFLFIYFLSGIGGGLASFAFAETVSAGASGAIFGLFGALLFFGLHHKRIFFQTMGPGLLLILGVNLVLGFTVEQIDMGAHIGGLITGFISSAVCHLPNNKEIRKQTAAAVMYLAVVVGLILFGIYNSANSQLHHLMEVEELIGSGEYEEVIEVATEALELNGNLQGLLLFQRAYAYIELNELDLAIQDLEESINHEEIPEAYYNLALLYENTDELEKAEEMIIRAYEMRPEEESFIQLYEQITGESVPDREES